MRLKRWLKQQFVPHQGNNHKPHFLSIKSVALVFVGVFLLEALLLSQIFFRLPSSDYLAAVLPSVLVDYTNQDRLDRGLGALKSNSTLQSAATLKAQDMASKGYFSHTTPDGFNPWYWLDLAGYGYLHAGENLAVNFVESRDVQTAWMNSEGHRANIVNPRYTEIGIATAQGVYQGRDTIFVVQFFGTPNLVATAPKPIPPVTIVPTPTPAEILGEEVAISVIPNSESEPVAETPIVAQAPTGANDLVNRAIEAAKAPVVEAGESSILAQFASNPRWIINMILGVLLLIVLVALFLKIFIKPKIQYPLLIANGVMLLAAISGAVYLNYFIFSRIYNGLVV